MNNYLIPANSKKGQLYFNLFRVEDLVVLLIGGLITLVLVFAISGDSLLTMALKLMPLGIAVLLVMPIAYYHNVMVFIKEMYIYFTTQSKFRWKGWCVTSGNENEQ